MKTAMRLVSVLLCMAIMLCSIPQSVLASAENTLHTDSDDAAKEVAADALGEIVELREANVKHFRMSDGSYRAVQYGKPVHYETASGEWLDYDNTLVLDASKSGTESRYSVRQSDLTVSFGASSGSSRLLSVGYNGYTVSLTPVNTTKSAVAAITSSLKITDSSKTLLEQLSTLTKLNSQISYKNIRSGVDIEYVVSGPEVKENIIVKSAANEYVYRFTLDSGALSAALDDDGNIILSDSDGNGVLAIPAGYMYDADGEFSDAVTYSLEADNSKRGSYLVTVTADKGWINSSDRAFPVTIDPTIVKYHTMYEGGRIKDTYVNSDNPNEDHGSYAWLSIDSNSTDEHISMIGIANESANSTVNLPAIPKSSVIVHAELRLRTRSDSATGVTVGAYQMTGDWNSYEVTYSTMPSHEPQLLDYFYVNSASSEYVLNITSAMQRWYNEPAGEYSKKGLKLLAIAGSGLVKLNSVNDSNYNDSYPTFIISYRDTKGLEGIWSFASHGAGNAGTGNVNTFNGNLVLVRDDTATKGAVLPVTVSHVYNSFMSGSEFTSGDDIITASFANMKSGKGWKLSVQETVVTKVLNGVTWYVLNDSDGTELYFKQESTDGYHLSEDGYPMKLKVNSSGTYKYEISDDYGNTKLFNSSGMLVKITDSFGNARNFVYASGRLTSITSTPNGAAAETQVTFTYNSANALQRITNGADSSEYTTFYYSSTYNGAVSSSYSGYLRKAVSTKNGTCLYEYNSNGTLKSTSDSDTSYKIEYTYADYHGVKRIATVTEKSGSTAGQKIGFSYADKETVVRTSGSDDVYNNSDDILTTYLFDNYGKTVCSYRATLPATRFTARHTRPTSLRFLLPERTTE